METELHDFLEAVLGTYFDVEDPVPHLHRQEVSTLLVDDGPRRLRQAETAAAEWGRAEALSQVQIVDERMVVTSRGLVYAAALRPSTELRATGSPRHEPPMAVTGRAGSSSSRRSQPSMLYYVATPRSSYDPFIDRVRTARIGPFTAAVDSRYGHEMDYLWPLDRPLRRSLDAHDLLIWV